MPESVGHGRLKVDVSGSNGSEGVTVTISHGMTNSSTFSVPGYPSIARKMDSALSHDHGEFVPVAHHQTLLAQMMHSHVAGDICLVGPKVSFSLEPTVQLASYFVVIYISTFNSVQ